MEEKAQAKRKDPISREDKIQELHQMIVDIYQHLGYSPYQTPLYGKAPGYTILHYQPYTSQAVSPWLFHTAYTPQPYFFGSVLPQGQIPIR